MMFIEYTLPPKSSLIHLKQHTNLLNYKWLIIQSQWGMNEDGTKIIDQIIFFTFKWPFWIIFLMEI